jgi:hypothetical protein
MILLGAVRRGLGSLGTHRRCAVLLWLCQAVLAAPVAALAWSWWSRTAMLPETDTLLDSFHLGVFLELLDAGRWQIVAIGLASLGLLLATVPLSALLHGAILDALAHDDPRPWLERCRRSAATYFLRFVAVAIIGGFVTLIVIGLMVLASMLVVRRLPVAWHPRWIQLGLVGIAWGYGLLALDYARIQIMLSGSRDALRAWCAAMGFVARHPIATGGVGVVFGALFVAALSLYLAISTVLPANTTVLIAVAFVIQQGFMLLRAGVRVGLLAGEVHVSQIMEPAGIAPIPWPDGQMAK